MALQVAGLLLAAQDRVPGYAVTLAPKATQRRLLSDIQRRLAAQALQAHASYLSQRLTVFLSPSAANAVGSAGAGSGSFALDGDALALAGGAGNTATINLANATELVPASVVDTASASTAKLVGAAFTVDAYVNKTAVIVAGTGAGPLGLRTILSNTADTLTLTADWSVTPDATSLIAIYDATGEVDADGAAVVQLMPTQTATGYLTKLDANGVAYLDLASPLTATFDAPIPLPPHSGLLGITARDDRGAADVALLGYALRNAFTGGRGCYVLGQRLFLMGVDADWAGVGSLDVRYQPVPLTLTADTDYLLLPEAAEDVLTSKLALAIALRLLGAGVGSGELVGALREDAQTAEGIYLNGVRGAGRARRHDRVDSGW